MKKRDKNDITCDQIMKMFCPKTQIVIPNLREIEIKNSEIRKQRILEKERIRREKMKEIEDANKENMSCNDIINLFLDKN
jgi:hypothetical protein